MNLVWLTILYFVASIVVVLIGVLLFELMTRQYKDWEEIQHGNIAVALSIGGKIIGICIVLAFSIFHNDTVLATFLWGLLGVALQLVAYLLFELFTRRFSVETELKAKNVAVGMISLSVSIGLGFVIGASIT
ncbi:DUF350 domain-containing protein [Bacillaceae bacterium SIJ1]|uniref:DUF350 domain-containing protein n=1 Tax=Litoribacterium kuwaitense TaxID=1398745 RepID=UPI0013ED9E7E|nr:DUF350 domain-containing protein [Litoribacterium kuwaitense]NGP45042.1 DUF350 domain-containing protein [Litoribacterium kuwaitense]